MTFPASFPNSLSGMFAAALVSHCTHDIEAGIRFYAPGSPAMVLVVRTYDADKAYQELTAAGVPAVQPPHDTGNNNRNALLRGRRKPGGDRRQALVR
jgi:hypothetical protein